MSEVAAYYDAYWSAEQEPYYEPDPVLAALLRDAVGPGDDVLDVGCGAARSYAPGLASRARSYAGVDVSATAVAAARASGLDARVVDSATALPFADASFDALVCFEVLEHLFDPAAAAAEALRVLRPGGRIVVSVPNAAYWRLRLSLLLGVFNPLGDEQSVARPWRDPHVRFFTPATMAAMLGEAGFRDVAVGAHGGRLLDHLTSRPTDFGGPSRLYRELERRRPALLGLTIHAVARR